MLWFSCIWWSRQFTHNWFLVVRLRVALILWIRFRCWITWVLSHGLSIGSCFLRDWWRWVCTWLRVRFTANVNWKFSNLDSIAPCTVHSPWARRTTCFRHRRWFGAFDDGRFFNDRLLFRRTTFWSRCWFCFCWWSFLPWFLFALGGIIWRENAFHFFRFIGGSCSSLRCFIRSRFGRRRFYVSTSLHLLLFDHGRWCFASNGWSSCRSGGIFRFIIRCRGQCFLLDFILHSFRFGLLSFGWRCFVFFGWINCRSTVLLRLLLLLRFGFSRCGNSFRLIRCSSRRFIIGYAFGRRCICIWLFRWRSRRRFRIVWRWIRYGGCRTAATSTSSRTWWIRIRTRWTGIRITGTATGRRRARTWTTRIGCGHRLKIWKQRCIGIEAKLVHRTTAKIPFFLTTFQIVRGVGIDRLNDFYTTQINYCMTCRWCAG